MNKLFYIILLIVGLVLTSYGVAASDSIGSSFSRFFNGSPTDKTLWLLIGGIVATVVGASGLLRSSRTP